MSDSKVVESLIKHAIGRLNYDDSNPDVGMGMFPSTAIEDSVEDVKKEGLHWTGFPITITQEDINLATKRVVEIRYPERK